MQQQQQEGELRKMLLLSPELFEKICKNEPTSLTKKRMALSQELIKPIQKRRNNITVKNNRKKQKSKRKSFVKTEPYQKWFKVRSLLTDYLKALKNNQEPIKIPIIEKREEKNATPFKKVASKNTTPFKKRTASKRRILKEFADVEEEDEDDDGNYYLSETLGPKRRRLDTTAVFPMGDTLRPRSRLKPPTWLSYDR